MLAKIKIVLMYALILVAGLGAGYVAAHFKEWTKSPYAQGNYSSHFPDASTKVVLYGTSTCPYCKSAREYFDSKKIKYRDIVLTAETEKTVTEAFNKLNTEGAVPAIIIGDRMIVGFNQPVIEDALKNAKVASGS